MGITRILIIALFAVSMSLGMGGCKEEGPAEKLGKDIDNAAEEMKEGAEKAAEDLKEATE